MNSAVVAERMAIQLRDHPDTSNAIWVATYWDARWIMHHLEEKVGAKNWTFDVSERVDRVDPSFSLWVGADSRHIGARITGLLLVEVQNLDKRLWWQPLLTGQGRWEDIS